MPSMRPPANADGPGLHACTSRSTRPRTSPRPSSPRRGPVAPSCASRASTRTSRCGYAITPARASTFDVHMSDLQAGALAGHVRACRLRRLQLRRHAGRRRGAGRARSCSPRSWPSSSPPSSAAATPSRWACNGCQMMARSRPSSPARGLAALRAQPERAVRGALSLVEVLAEPVHLLHRHGRQPPCRSRWRTARLRRLLGARRRASGAARDALRRPPGKPTGPTRQPERLAPTA